MLKSDQTSLDMSKKYCSCGCIYNLFFTQKLLKCLKLECRSFVSSFWQREQSQDHCRHALELCHSLHCFHCCSCKMLYKLLCASHSSSGMIVSISEFDTFSLGKLHGYSIIILSPFKLDESSLDSRSLHSCIHMASKGLSLKMQWLA